MNDIKEENDMQKATGHIRPRKRKDGQRAFQLIAELLPDPLTGKRQRKYATIIGSKKEAEKALPSGSLRKEVSYAAKRSWSKKDTLSRSSPYQRLFDDCQWH